MKIDKDREFYTGINLAAWLVMRGFQLLRLEFDNEKNKAMFIFEKTDKLIEAIKAFKGEALIQGYLANQSLLGYKAREFVRSLKKSKGENA